MLVNGNEAMQENNMMDDGMATDYQKTETKND